MWEKECLGRIAVFDSGFGSLSIINAIQKYTKADIIYFADQKNFPYGKKSKAKLEKIIKHTISNLKEKFHPDLIVVGSNTPTLLANKIISNDPMVIGVLPPILYAQNITKTNCIALLVTNSIAKSFALSNFIKKNHKMKIKFLTIDSSDLVELVETGTFIDKKSLCTEKIISILQKKFVKYNVDVATLSSTHLPFLLPLLQQIFPQVEFLDPADSVAKQIKRNKLFFPSKKNTLKIYTSGNAKKFQKLLHQIGIKRSVHQINF
jgi:glutamate racemase